MADDADEVAASTVLEASSLEQAASGTMVIAPIAVAAKALRTVNMSVNLPCSSLERCGSFGAACRADGLHLDPCWERDNLLPDKPDWQTGKFPNVHCHVSEE
ncbi:hypothetical protein [Rhodococcus sp. 06-235-1A]|uniref:hypothetical protein n=1 Tax=Rhodococcus sp. 06-235-1A TaxID=2022508 RepID=UPI00211B6E6F|nr:hypothetical protein [Rhodococcus sp. 06-235-1A]